MFNIVEKEMKKKLDYIIKEYTLTKHNYDIGKHVLIFNPARKVCEASKFETRLVSSILHNQENKRPLLWNGKPEPN